MSPTDICNQALLKLGAGRITSLTDSSTAARACNSCYLPKRDALLRAHPWNFSIERHALAANATAPAFGPASAYPLPTGWLKLLPPDPQLHFNTRDWIVEGGQVITNDAAPLNVRCVMKIEDSTLFDPLFCEALACLLAMEMAEQLTQSNTKKDAAEKAYKAAIAEARKANAIEKVPQEAVEDTWLSVRLNDTSSSGWGTVV